jgi:hypothetical protein
VLGHPRRAANLAPVPSGPSLYACCPPGVVLRSSTGKVCPFAHRRVSGFSSRWGLGPTCSSHAPQPGRLQVVVKLVSCIPRLSMPKCRVQKNAANVPSKTNGCASPAALPLARTAAPTSAQSPRAFRRDGDATVMRANRRGGPTAGLPSVRVAACRSQKKGEAASPLLRVPGASRANRPRRLVGEGGLPRTTRGSRDRPVRSLRQ